MGFVGNMIRNARNADSMAGTFGLLAGGALLMLAVAIGGGGSRRRR